MRQWCQIAAALSLAWSTTGCVLAARQLAREASRSSYQDKGRKRFASGTSIATARATLTADGYRCLDIPEYKKIGQHVSCSPTAHRTAGVEKFLIGGDWRWDLFGNGDVLTRVHIASARNGFHRAVKPGAKAT